MGCCKARAGATPLDVASTAPSFVACSQSRCSYSSVGPAAGPLCIVVAVDGEVVSSRLSVPCITPSPTNWSGSELLGAFAATTERLASACLDFAAVHRSAATSRRRCAHSSELSSCRCCTRSGELSDVDGMLER